MPSTYTVNLGIEKPATGEQSGTWGDTTNTNFDILDQGINGAVRVTLSSAGSSGSPNALQITNGAASDGRNKWIEFYSSGDLGGSAYVQLDPNDAEKIVFVRNSLASSRSVILFQGTYNAARDLEVPAGVDMVVKFDGGGASAATVTDVYTNLRVTALTTPSLTATTADINGGTVDNAVIGGSTPAALTATTIVANTSLNIAGDGATVTGIKDEDNMSSNSATKLATQQSIKAYVDSQVGTVDTLAEILANGNTSGSNNLIINNGQALTSNTINETTAGSGVTIDSVLLKDDVVNATDVEIGSISANDGTAAATIANSTGNFTITNFISNSVDIGGGAIDGTVIGGASAAAGSFTTIGATGAVTGASSFSTAAGGTFTTASGNDLNIVYPDSRSLFFKEGSTTTLTLDNAQGATFGGNVTMQADDALLFIKETDGTNIAAVGDLTGSGQGGAFYYNHGGTAVIQLKSYEASQINSGIVFNEDSADVDFRVEGNNNANMIFVDGANDYVSIATTDDYGKNLNVSGGLEVRGTGDSIELQQSSAGSATYYAMDNTVETGGKRYRFGYSGGTADKGSFSFYNQTDDLLNLVLSDDANVFNEDSKDVDFRVESDGNTHMLFVDAEANEVGIGTSDPRSPLHVQIAHSSTDVTAANTNSTLSIGNSTAGNGIYNAIKFSANQQDMYIMSFNNGTQANRRIGFFLGSVAGDATTDERLSINGDGFTGIGTGANIDEMLHVERSSGTTIVKTEVAANSVIGFEIKKTNATTANWRIVDGQVANGQLEIWDNTNSRSIINANSTEITVNDTGANLDFIVEGDTRNVIFVDAANDRIGMGTSAPQTDVHMSAGSGVELMMTRTSAATSGQLGNIRFGNEDFDSNLANIGAHQDGSKTAAYLSFETQSAGAATGERMRIQSDGAVVLKPNGITTGLRLQGRSSDNNFYIQWKSNDGSATYGSIGTDSANTSLQYNTDIHDFNSASSGTNFLELKSTEATFNEGGADMDFRVESDNASDALRIYDDTFKVGLQRFSHNGRLTYAKYFTSNASTNTRVTVTIPNYTLVKVEMMGLRTNSGDSICYWNGYISNNDNTGRYDELQSVTGGTMSFTFTANNGGQGIFTWDFNNAGSGGSGNFKLELGYGDITSIVQGTY